MGRNCCAFRLRFEKCIAIAAPIIEISSQATALSYNFFITVFWARNMIFVTKIVLLHGVTAHPVHAVFVSVVFEA